MPEPDENEVEQTETPSDEPESEDTSFGETVEGTDPEEGLE